MSELLPCPWCAGDLVASVQEEDNWWAVFCITCHSQGPLAETKPDAIKLWNTRHTESASKGANDEPDELGCRHCRECDVFCPTLNGTGASE